MELEILYAALGSRFGIAVEVSDMQIAQSRLYAARARSGDPDLDKLMLRKSPYNPQGELWIIKARRPEQ